MRTKTLLVTLALSASCAISSIAQVYSVNAVGYVNDVMKAGFSMHSCPLKVADYSLDALLGPGGAGPVPDGCQIYKWASGNFRVIVKSPIGLGWLDPDGNPCGTTEKIDFGSGFMIWNATGADFTVTWVGEVDQGGPTCGGAAIVNPVKAGFSFMSSRVPQKGKVQSELGFPMAPGDAVYKWDGNFHIYSSSVIGDGSVDYWIDQATGDMGPQSEPSLEVAESFLFLNQQGADRNWSRNFCVNQP